MVWWFDVKVIWYLWWVRAAKVRDNFRQEPITWSVQLPYCAYATAFSQVGLVGLDKPFPRIAFEEPITSNCVINSKLLIRNQYFSIYTETSSSEEDLQIVEEPRTSTSSATMHNSRKGKSKSSSKQPTVKRS